MGRRQPRLQHTDRVDGLQADGKILISGAFTVVSGTNYNGIARLDTNASLDVTFNPGTAAQNGSIKAIGLQSTGDIIVGGTLRHLMASNAIMSLA